MLFDKFIIPVMVTMPAIWSFVTPEYYERSKLLLGGDPKYDILLATADKYHYEVRLRTEALISEAMHSGTKVAVICSYGMAPIPVVKNADYHSDNLIDSELASGGATFARLGQTLPPGNQKYRSPDGIIDASTALLPDNTWFVKYNDHSAGAMYDLRMWIIHADEQPTVWQNPDFPQFLRRVENRAVPLG